MPRSTPPPTAPTSVWPAASPRASGTRRWPISATVNGTVYLFGGWDGSSVNATIYSTTDGTHFRVAGRLPQGLRYTAVADLGHGERDRVPVRRVGRIVRQCHDLLHHRRHPLPCGRPPPPGPPVHGGGRSRPR